VSVECTVDIEGVEEFREALRRLDAATLENVRRQLEMWAQTVKDIARAKVPVRTGYLRSTIFAKIRDWVAEVGAEATYAAYVEFGTQYMRAQPYLRPALEAQYDVLEQIIVEAIEAAKREAGFK